MRVPDQYRINPLHLKPTNCTIFVMDPNGRIKEYDNIHFPNAYAKKVKQSTGGKSIVKWWYKDKPEKVYEV